MRFVAIAILLLAYPAFVAWLKANPGRRHWAYFAVGLLPFTINAWNLDAALINWAMWSGYAKGMIITLLDSLALAIITVNRRPSGLPPLSGWLIAYILATALSVPMAGVPTAAFFYVFQLLRVLILMIAVAKIAADPRALQWIGMGLAAGMSYQAGYCIWQKANGAFQAAGTMGHQNLLGQMAHFVTFPLLGMLLGGVRSRMVMLGIASCLIVVALGASRGAIGFTAMAFVALFVLSMARHSTPRKWRMLAYAALVMAAISPIMMQSISNRLAQFSTGPQGGDERAAFERAAKAMFADYPTGVGANQYVIVANTQGYSKRAGVNWNWTSRSANVHNTYLLVAAETGWPGIVAFLTMFVMTLIAGLQFAFQNRRDPRGEIVLGCTVAVGVTAAHNQYEWIFVTSSTQYLFAISLGIIGGLIRARASERTARRNSPTPDAFPEIAFQKEADGAERIGKAPEFTWNYPSKPAETRFGEQA